MTKHWSRPATEDDAKLLDELLAEVVPLIGDAMTTLGQHGSRLSQMAAMFERTFDGQVRGSVNHRAEVAKWVMSDRRLPPAALTTILDALRTARPEELPIVLLVDRGEGVVAVGVRRERGQLVSAS